MNEAVAIIGWILFVVALIYAGVMTFLQLKQKDTPDCRTSHAGTTDCKSCTDQLKTINGYLSDCRASHAGAADCKNYTDELKKVRKDLQTTTDDVLICNEANNTLSGLPQAHRHSWSD